MKTVRTLITFSLFIVACTATALGQSIQTDYDHSFNLSSLKTYAFTPPQRHGNDLLASSPINDRRIYNALDQQLRANGLTESGQPDFLVSYRVTTRKNLDIQDNRHGPLQRLGGSINVNEITEGTIVVTFVDNASSLEVWRGYVSGAINPKDLDKDVNKGISKLIQKFRKDQGGQK